MTSSVILLPCSFRLGDPAQGVGFEKNISCALGS